MKLNELNNTPTRKVNKVFESYYGKNAEMKKLTLKESRALLNRVRDTLREHRRTASFHTSEQNPLYLKLLMMEKVLVNKLGENTVPPSPSTPAQSLSATPTQNVQDKNKLKAAQTQAIQKIQDPNIKKAIQKTSTGQTLNRDEQDAVAGALIGQPIQKEGRQRFQHWARYLKESEVQQAQVVLAAQDMVDQVQKMIEDTTAIQFKDLPALADQIKNEVGVQQAGQFNTDANTALTTLVQALQGAKQQLEQALGVVTGDQMTVPGQTDADAMPPMGSPEIPDIGGDDQVPELPPEKDEEEITIDRERTPPKNFGRKRR